MEPQLYNSPFMQACRGEATDYTPVWLNRQAGRYMKEYHQVKGKTPSLAFFKTPDLAAQVTCDAQRILGTDAAILFADLLPILEPMGLALDYLPDLGPKISNPVRSAADVDALQVLPSVETMPYINEAIQLIRRELPADIPLIGFGGAPFTLASYAIEGQGSRNYTNVKRMMHNDPGLWHHLMEKITDCAIDYLDYQVKSGVQAIQVFDSWVGILSVEDYQTHVFPHSQRLLQAISDLSNSDPSNSNPSSSDSANSDSSSSNQASSDPSNRNLASSNKVPVIHFGTGNPALLPLMAEAGGDVMALDWRAPLVKTWDQLGVKAVQGNLDPVILLADWPAVERATRKLLTDVNGRPGHIFNLGHGILPETPVENVKALVKLVQGFRSMN